MYQPSFSAPPSARILARACALLVVATSLFVAACGGTSTTTNKTDCFTQSPELRFWMRDTVAVALRLPSDVTLADQDVSSAVLSAINPALERQRLGDLNSSGSTDQKASLLVRGTSDAVAFYTLPPPASSDVSALCDQRVIKLGQYDQRSAQPEFWPGGRVYGLDPLGGTGEGERDVEYGSGLDPGSVA